jgi:hypothetical protein
MPCTPTWSPFRAKHTLTDKTYTFIYNPASYGRTLPYVYSHLKPWFSRTPHPQKGDIVLHLQDGCFNNVPLIYASQCNFHDNVSITKKSSIGLVWFQSYEVSRRRRRHKPCVWPMGFRSDFNSNAGKGFTPSHSISLPVPYHIQFD